MNLRKSKHYTSWRKIKERCYNTNCPDYSDYGGRGLILSDNLRYNFNAFCSELGPVPDKSKFWSVDRIDNTKGYVEGNIRWATSFQQARNKGMASNNTSGVTGVQFYDHKTKTNRWLYVVATWHEYTGGDHKIRNKKFAVKTLGLLEAFAQACQFRSDKIEELNNNGYGYSDKHGKIIK